MTDEEIRMRCLEAAINFTIQIETESGFLDRTQYMAEQLRKWVIKDRLIQETRNRIVVEKISQERKD